MSAVKGDKQIRALLAQYGEDFDAACWRVQGNAVIYHDALERIAVQAGVAFDPPVIIRAEAEEAVILVTGRLGERVEWSIGEARLGVNYRVSGKQPAYVYAMSEKRGRDRVILKLVGLHGLLYSEEEADEFKDTRPTVYDPATGGQAEAKPAPADGGRVLAHLPHGKTVKANVAPPPPKQGVDAADDFPGNEALRELQNQAAEAPTTALANRVHHIVPELALRIDKAATINKVTDLMLSPDAQADLARLDSADRDLVRGYAKARLIALGWSHKPAAHDRQTTH